MNTRFTHHSSLEDSVTRRTEDAPASVVPCSHIGLHHVYLGSRRPAAPVAELEKGTYARLLLICSMGMLEPLSVPSASDATETYPAHPAWNGIAPFPNERMMFHVGAPSLENFLVVGDAWGQLVAKELAPDARVLDIGCGCGWTARFLLHNPHLREYVGLDVIRPFIDWDTRYLSPLTSGRCQFLHLDVRSAHYNPGGALPPEAAKFPLENARLTMAFATSVHASKGNRRGPLSGRVTA